MANSQLKFLMLSVCILVTQTTKGEIIGNLTLAPLNRVVYEGTTNTKITCQTNVTFMDWYLGSFACTGEEYSYMPFLPLTDNGELIPPFNEAFAIEHSPGSEVFTLIVFNTTISPTYKTNCSMAGLYFCYSKTTTEMSNGVIRFEEELGGGKLVVIKTDPVCSSNFTQSTAMLHSGDAIELSCTIVYGDYRDYPIDAVMTWSVNGQPIPADIANITIDSSSTEVTASSTLVINDNFDSIYECATTFSQPRNIPYYFLSSIASNAPDYYKTCTVSISQPTTVSTTAAVTPCSPSSPSTSTSDQCLPTLINIAVYEGQLNTIMTLSTDPLGVKWNVLPTSDETSLQNIIDIGCNKNPSLTQLYDVYQTGLLIKKATTIGNPISTSGLYVGQCSNNPKKTGAKFLVVRTGPQCSRISINSTSSNISCNVTFADSALHPIRPIITWRLNGTNLGSYILPRKRIDPYVYFATSTITTNSGTYENYQCELTFAVPTDIQYPWIATNAPKFNESCFTNP